MEYLSHQKSCAIKEKDPSLKKKELSGLSVIHIEYTILSDHLPGYTLYFL